MSSEPVPGYEPGLSDDAVAPNALDATLELPPEREPAIRKCLHYNGDNVEELKRRYYFGPTYDPAGGPGHVWKIRHAEYDAKTDRTTAWYAPVAEHELNQVLAEIHRRMNA